MLVPFSYSETPEQRYSRKLSDKQKKAKNLVERIHNFTKDLDGTILKDKDKKKIKTLLKESLNKTIELL